MEGIWDGGEAELRESCVEGRLVGGEAWKWGHRVDESDENRYAKKKNETESSKQNGMSSIAFT